LRKALKREVHSNYQVQIKKRKEKFFYINKYLGNIEFESLFHEYGQTRDESVEAPIETKLANINCMNGS
jgi:hypothetical protein